MSYLSIELQRQSERRALNQSELAQASGLSRSFISRVLSGESRDVSDDNFIRLLKAFAADRGAQAELVAARCRDARVGPGAESVDIQVKGGGKAERRESESEERVHLSEETERAFAWLRRQCPLNPNLEQHLVGYARLTGMK